MPFTAPVILGIIGATTAAAGTAVSAVGQVKAGNAAKNVGEYNASVDEQNAQNSLADATTSEAQQRVRDSHVIAAGRAIAGASGVDVNSGSPLDVQAENQKQAEMNALNIRRSGQTRAQAFIADAQSQRMQGKNAQAASMYGAAGTILTGGANVARYASALTATRQPRVQPNGS
jgi:hypothetical protein